MADMGATASKTAGKHVLVPGTTYYLSLHSANPGTTGANELSGGTYARKAFKMGTPASTGLMKSTTPASISAKTGSVTSKVPYVGVWTAATGGTYVIGGSSGLGTTTTFAAGTTLVFTKTNTTLKVS